MGNRVKPGEDEVRRGRGAADRGGMAEGWTPPIPLEGRKRYVTARISPSASVRRFNSASEPTVMRR